MHAIALLLTVELKDWPTIAVAVLIIIGALVLCVVYIRGKYGAEIQEAGEQATGTWRELAEGRLGRIADLEAEKEGLQQQVQSLRGHLTDCEKLRDEFALFNLRLQAKNRNYEKCINRLEKELNLQETNFEDPTPP